MIGECCKCFHWYQDPNATTRDKGRCQRYPPQPIDGFPRTYAIETCGEFKEKGIREDQGLEKLYPPGYYWAKVQGEIYRVHIDDQERVVFYAKNKPTMFWFPWLKGRVPHKLSVLRDKDIVMGPRIEPPEDF